MSNSGFKAVLVDYDEDLFSPRGWEGAMLAQAGIAWETGQHRTPDAAQAAARDADVVMVQSVRRLLTRITIEELANCRCIVRLGIGFDSVDVEAATAHGILVCNVPTYCVDDVAEHTLALLFDSARHVARQDRWIRAGRWDRRGARPARRLRGSTLGLLSFGRIARAVVQRLSGFEMTALAYDPYVDAETMASFGVQKAELDELLANSDFLSVHSPLTDETYHLLSGREFDLMRDGVYLVNTSRGPVIDEAALVEALRSGKIWGVGLDVMEQEPLPPGSALREFENVSFTPHVGASSEDSVDDLYRTACRIAIDVVEGYWPDEVVNPDVAGKTRGAYIQKQRPGG